MIPNKSNSISSFANIKNSREPALKSKYNGTTHGRTNLDTDSFKDKIALSGSKVKLDKMQKEDTLYENADKI